MPETLALTFVHYCVHCRVEFTRNQIDADLTTLDYPCPECGKPLVGKFRPLNDFEIGLSNEKVAVGTTGVY